MSEAEVLRALIDDIRAEALRWSELAPADDWGADMVDTVVSDVGRGLLRKIEPVLEELEKGQSDE